MSLRRVLPLLAVLALLTAPVAAWGSPSRGADNGTLSILGGRGTVDLQATGSVIAKIRKGKVKVKIYKHRHAKGADQGQVSIRMRGHGTITHKQSGIVVYNGRKISVTIKDKKFRLQIKGVGIHLSAVATGQVTLQADPNAADPGSFSIDDADSQALPEFATTYQLGS